MLIFAGLGYNNKNQASVIIYNQSGSIEYSGSTYNAKLFINLKINSLYKLCAYNNTMKIFRYFYVSKYQKKYLFIFPSALYNPNPGRIITLLLSDYNYDNMPIEKGVIKIGENS